MSVAEPTVIPVAPTVVSEELSLRTGRGRVLLGTMTAAHFAHHTSNSLLNPLLGVLLVATSLFAVVAGRGMSQG